MKTWFLALALGLAPLAGGANDTLVKFDGGIGVDPVSAVGPDGTALLNNVRGFFPGGLPWVISRLEAQVKADGRIRVDGRGLLLAGGSSIGTSAGLAVRAVLLCGAPNTSTAHVSDAPGVTLSPAGDFTIEGELTPPPPVPCDTPAFLIVTATGGRWLAAGIPDVR